MIIVYIIVAGIFFLEIVARFVIAYKFKTFGSKNFLEVLSNPTLGLDGRKFNNFGEINDKIIKRLFRFTTQAAYMGMSDKELQNIMARANQTNVEIIKDAYTGSKGFEKSRYGSRSAWRLQSGRLYLCRPCCHICFVCRHDVH